MSAGTELDRAAIATGAFTPVEVVTVSSSPQRRSGPAPYDRRRRDPIALLGREHDAMCTQAVDPDEIAAGLEAAGINDRVVRERYGLANVFELAQILYVEVPRRPRELKRAVDPWDVPTVRHIARGAVYALPLLPYIAALRVFHASGDLAILLIGSTMAMALSQGVAFVAYTLLGGLEGPVAARRFLRLALIVTVLGALTLVLGSVVVLGLARGPSSVAAVGVVAGQLVFVVAATTLMVVHQERLVLIALVPGVAAGVLSLPGLVGYESTALPAAGLVVSLLLTLGFAARAVPLPRTPLTTPLLPARSRRALLHVAYGAVASGLVMSAVLDCIQLGSAGTADLLGIGMLPFVLSLGGAEALLHRFRSEASAAMRESYGFEHFATHARAAMVRAATAYAAMLFALSGLMMPFVMVGGTSTAETLRYLAYGLLALALFAAMLMISCGAVEQAVVILAIGLVADMAVRLRADVDPVTLTVEHITVYAVILVVMWAAALHTLASPFRHR